MLRRRLLRIVLAVALVVGLLLAWSLSYRAPAYPPPAAIVLSSTNGSLTVTPGIGGVLFVLPDGSLWRWGLAGLPRRATIPARVGKDSDWSQATPGNNGFVGVKRDGTLWQAGWVAGSVNHGATPRQIDTNTDWAFATKVDVAAAALKTDGTLWTWGDPMKAGSLGDPAAAVRSVPGRVGTNRWRCITGAGSNYGYVGVTQGGELRAWGLPHQPGPTFDRPTPFLASHTWVTAGMNLFLDSTRSLWVGPAEWRSGLASTNPIALVCTNATPGRYGAAGTTLYEIRPDGTLWSRPLPIALPWARKQSGAAARLGDRADWLQLWSGAGVCLGLTGDGTLWTWGTDWGAEPQLDTASQIRKTIHDVVNGACDRLGIRRLIRRLSTSGQLPSGTDPRPLLRLTPAPTPTSPSGP